MAHDCPKSASPASEQQVSQRQDSSLSTIAADAATSLLVSLRSVIDPEAAASTVARMGSPTAVVVDPAGERIAAYATPLISGIDPAADGSSVPTIEIGRAHV